MSSDLQLRACRFGGVEGGCLVRVSLDVLLRIMLRLGCSQLQVHVDPHELFLFVGGLCCGAEDPNNKIEYHPKMHYNSRCRCQSVLENACVTMGRLHDMRTQSVDRVIGPPGAWCLVA